MKKPATNDIPFRTIIFATDLHHDSVKEAAVALAFAKDTVGRIYMCHVISHPPSDLTDSLDLQFTSEKELSKLIPATDYEWCSPECSVEYGNAGGHIVQIAETKGADLIVLGARRNTTWFTHLTEGTAAQVISAASCPVMTVCGDWGEATMRVPLEQRGDPCPSRRWFCNLPAEVLLRLQSIGMQMHLPKGAMLFQAGDPAGNMAMLCEGQIKLQTTSREGKASIVRVALPGDVLGLGVVISGSCYEMTAEALEPAIVRSISRDEFLTFLERHAQISMYAARVLSEEYKSAFFDAGSVMVPASAAGRVAAVLLELGRNASSEGDEPRFTVALTHEEIANLAATSRETVTRMLSRFKRERWIRIRGSSITILAPERLLQLSS